MIAIGPELLICIIKQRNPPDIQTAIFKYDPKCDEKRGKEEYKWQGLPADTTYKHCY